MYARLVPWGKLLSKKVLLLNMIVKRIVQNVQNYNSLKTALSNEWTLTINPTTLTESVGVAVVQAGSAATAGTFTGNSFAAYDFDTNPDQTLTVIAVTMDGKNLCCFAG